MTNTEFRITSVILSAGKSERMGFPKAILRLGDTTFLGHILRSHLAVGSDVCVVLGEHYDRIAEAVDLSAALCLRNPTPELGQLSSLKLALRRFPDRNALLVHPVDHPPASRSKMSWRQLKGS